jgi:NAD(P) transhydrogenase subunit beta
MQMPVNYFHLAAAAGPTPVPADGSVAKLLINLAYIAASIIFIFGIRMLGRVETARPGNALSAVGMLIAIVATLLDRAILSYTWIIGGLAIGSIVGGIWAHRAKMTQMPELVAMYNGFGGLASFLVGWAEYDRILGLGWVKYLAHPDHQAVPAWFTLLAIYLTILIGAVTFTGSVVAWAKLAAVMSGRPTQFGGQKALNLLLIAATAAAGLVWIARPDEPWSYGVFICFAVTSLLLGWLGILPIGGGDMPVVIALLNSFSGLAGCAAGFVVLNSVLIVAGCLVGASGVILSVIMCKAMNRTLANVLFGGFGAASQKSAAAATGETKAISVEDAYYVLEAAGNVVIVPGYGMAVAQAQHVVKEVADMLEEQGTEVRYAIHPVAGRMPGHMNVLLAEADVPYEQLCEMDSINPTMPMVDVAIVIGANDVVNPAAIDDPSSPIYGMPIINVHEARTVFVLKRGQGTGFSGLENSLFYRPNCRMIYGDAKQTLTALAAQLKQV